MKISSQPGLQGGGKPRPYHMTTALPPTSDEGENLTPGLQGGGKPRPYYMTPMGARTSHL